MFTTTKPNNSKGVKTMTDLLRFLAKRTRIVLNPFSNVREYIRPKRGDAHQDLVRIIGDMSHLGSDLTKNANNALSQYGR